eukprot:scaffold1431_cov346-Pavlova_lutheri.AAC.30
MPGPCPRKIRSTKTICKHKCSPENHPSNLVRTHLDVGSLDLATAQAKTRAQGWELQLCPTAGRDHNTPRWP